MKEIATIIPLYDAQNLQVARNLSAPPNTTLLQEVYAGPTYGRRLELYYTSSLKFDEVKTYYNDQMLHAGWTATEIDSARFIHNDSCVWVLIPIEHYMKTNKVPTPEPGNVVYYVAIWHDFFKQSFSVPTPQGANLCADATDCETCP